MVRNLQATKYSLDEKLDQSFIQLFKGATPFQQNEGDDSGRLREDADDLQDDGGESDTPVEDELSVELNTSNSLVQVAQAGAPSANTTRGFSNESSSDEQSTDDSDGDSDASEVGRLIKLGGSSRVTQEAGGSGWNSEARSATDGCGPTEVRELVDGRIRRRAVFTDNESGQNHESEEARDDDSSEEDEVKLKNLVESKFELAGDYSRQGGSVLEV